MSTVVRVNERRFDPWVGANYKAGFHGVRVFLLGESHYGKPEEDKPNFTEGVVRRYTAEGERLAFFTKIAALFMHDRKGEYVDKARLRKFYDQVLFYNYVQELLDCSRKAPTAEQWRAAREPLTETLHEHQPALVVILGRRLAGYAEPVVKAAGFLHCTLPHPSSTATRHDIHHPKLLKALEAARAR